MNPHLSIVRHLIAIGLLPFTVVVVVPLWLASWPQPDTGWPAGGVAEIGGRVVGAVLFAAGLALFTWCVTLFARIGQGTLAPWDPTRRLVVVGPYRHVRNPMITSVALMLAGEASWLGSRRIALWLALFVAINHLYFLIAEEPGLARRFGEEYRAYKSAVPRWLPRWTPYDRDVTTRRDT